MTGVTATYYGDPLSVPGYRHRPTLARARYRYPGLDWRYRCLLAVPDPLDGDEATATATALATIQDTVGLPTTPGAFTETVPASWWACRGVAAARAHTDATGVFTLAAELAARAFATGSPATDADGVAAAADPVPGLDAAALAATLDTHRATTAVGRDLERMRQLVDSLDTVDVRGDPPTAALTPRSCPDTPDDGAAVFAAPVFHLDAGDDAVLVDAAAGADAIDTALDRLAPDAGRAPEPATAQSRDIMETYGTPARDAERLTAEDYPAQITAVLEALECAYIPEVATCLDLTDRTCEVALHEMAAAGTVTRTPTGAWTLAPEE